VVREPVEVVEHDQHLAARRQRRTHATRIGPAREGQRVDDARLVPRARQIAEHHRRPRARSDAAQGMLDRERGLADAARPEQRDEPRSLVEARRQRRELGLAPDERDRAGHRGRGHGVTLPQIRYHHA